MLIPHFNEAALREHATHKSFDRGLDYYHAGAVIAISQRGNCIYAEVGGRESEDYSISLEFNDQGVTIADCTCPYDFGGWCKHLVAVGLTCLHQPEAVPELPTLEQQLLRLDYEQIQALVHELVDTRPNLLSEIDRFVKCTTKITDQRTSPSHQSKSPATVNTKPYRHRTQQMMHRVAKYWNGDDDWDEGNPFYEELPEILAEVQTFLDDGEPENALAVLTAITETIAQNWAEVDEYGGDSDGMMRELDPLWATTILWNELSEEDVVDLQVELAEWQDIWGGNFILSELALEQGWEDSLLQAVLQGESNNMWGGERPIGADQLALIRLGILEQEERYAEYLNLANAEGQILEYVLMLIRLERIPEVIAAADRLETTNHFLTVAKALYERGDLAEALAIAQIGLDLSMAESTQEFSENGRYLLADWTSDLALELTIVRTVLWCHRSILNKAFVVRMDFNQC
jgi:uncharacterized Zn finger protein